MYLIWAGKDYSEGSAIAYSKTKKDVISQLKNLGFEKKNFKLGSPLYLSNNGYWVRIDEIDECSENILKIFCNLKGYSND